ncbi:MAG TPA: M64 family metallopeptidase [Bacteroidales bacterium]|nr:M64 family metallopeptidase [Bacteroidales bacterium]HPT21066.1 M64 family metallopeptidase [Bacteroidales bacterium]
MKWIISFILLSLSVTSPAQGNFEKYFTNKVLRFDFMLAGNSQKTVVYPVGMKEEPFWGGSITNMIDHFNYGNFRYEVYDVAENVLIYSKGFCTLYQEWQTTDEAKVMERCFYEVATMPFPKNKIRFVLNIRERNGSFSKLYETTIDPADYFIRKENTMNAGVTKIYYSGDSHNCVDLVFIAEGYKADEMGKFREDVKDMADYLFSEAPFNDYRKKFNIWAVESVSQDSGTDIPGENIYANTVLNSSFYTFNTDRYLTTQDIKSVNDYAALVPHDAIIVLINSTKYGGGGVYNYYCGTTTGHKLSKKVFIHEFGHSFAGLADEYYSSSVAYDEFYPLDVEPWEPNITTMVNFDSKWKKMVGKNIPVPTPAEEKYNKTTGVFEGGGYSAKGIYRPEIECRMKSNTSKGFCSVCRESIKEMIEFYTR